MVVAAPGWRADFWNTASTTKIGTRVRSATAIESLGHVDFKWYVDRFSEWLAAKGDSVGASKVQDSLYETMARREVGGRRVLTGVLDEIKAQADDYNKGKGARRARVSATPEAS